MVHGHTGGVGGPPPPHKPEGPSGGEPTYKTPLGVLWVDLFNATADLYLEVVQHGLKVLNDRISQLSSQEEAIAKAMHGKSGSALLQLREEQQQCQTEINSANAALSAGTSAVTAMSNVMSMVVSSLKNVETAISQYWS